MVHVDMRPVLEECHTFKAVLRCLSSGRERAMTLLQENDMRALAKEEQMLLLRSLALKYRHTHSLYHIH